MKAGKKLCSHASSSAVFTKSSIGTIASSSISVNMSVDSNTDVVGGLPLLCARPGVVHSSGRPRTSPEAPVSLTGPHHFPSSLVVVTHRNTRLHHCRLSEIGQHLQQGPAPV